MRKRGKTIRNGMILGVVCVALAVAYFVITANENPAAKGVLYELGNDKITNVAIENTFGSFSFYQQDGNWVVESNGVYRTNPEKMKLLLGCLETFSISRMLTDEKAEYGFEAPQAQVSVKTEQGETFNFTVGNDAISGSSVYIKSKDGVMLTSTAMTSQLTGSLAAYRAKDVLMIDPAQIRSIEYSVEGIQTLALTNTDYHHWNMKYPFAVPGREVILNELIAKLRTLAIASYVDATSGIGDTGLEEPAASMTLTDQNGVTQTLDFGTVEDTLQYVRIGGKSDIVQLYAADLDFSNLTPEGLMYIAPLDIPVDEVQSVQIEADGQNDLFVIDRNGGTIRATRNGEAIDYTDTFVSIFFKCITINADGYDTSAPKPGKEQAVIAVTKTNGETVQLSLFQRDETTLYLYVDGEPVQSGEFSFFADAGSLQELLFRLRGAGQ